MGLDFSKAKSLDFRRISRLFLYLFFYYIFILNFTQNSYYFGIIITDIFNILSFFFSYSFYFYYFYHDLRLILQILSFFYKKLPLQPYVFYIILFFPFKVHYNFLFEFRSFQPFLSDLNIFFLHQIFIIFLLFNIIISLFKIITSIKL